MVRATIRDNRNALYARQKPRHLLPADQQNLQISRQMRPCTVLVLLAAEAQGPPKCLRENTAKSLIQSNGLLWRADSGRFFPNCHSWDGTVILPWSQNLWTVKLRRGLWNLGQLFLLKDTAWLGFWNVEIGHEFCASHDSKGSQEPIM